jgi:hypothetical protein
LLLARSHAIALWGALLLPAVARAERATTRESLDRFEETIAGRTVDANFNTKALLPVIVVSVAPAFEETKTWYPTAALAALIHVFGAGGVRSCEACMSSRTFVESNRLETDSGPIGLDDIIRLDDASRGAAAPAKSAVWLDETVDGVSLRIVDLRTGRIVVAENFDPRLEERARSERVFTLTKELDRRARGDSITQLFADFVLYPGQHISLDWTEQWGDTNANLSGFTVSLFDPILGVGGNYYRVIPEAFNLMIGAQLLLSVPSALIQAVGVTNNTSFAGDHLITLAAIIRVPLFRSNYGIVLSGSTNGRFGIGISLMNVSLLPVLP